MIILVNQEEIVDSCHQDNVNITMIALPHPVFHHPPDDDKPMTESARIQAAKENFTRTARGKFTSAVNLNHIEPTSWMSPSAILGAIQDSLVRLLLHCDPSFGLG